MSPYVYGVNSYRWNSEPSILHPWALPGASSPRELNLAFQISCTDSTFHRFGSLGDSEDNIQAEKALVPVVHAFPPLDRWYPLRVTPDVAEMKAGVPATQAVHSSQCTGSFLVPCSFPQPNPGSPLDGLVSSTTSRSQE